MKGDPASLLSKVEAVNAPNGRRREDAGAATRGTEQ
jgi:hypothetical protein